MRNSAETVTDRDTWFPAVVKNISLFFLSQGSRGQQCDWPEWSGECGQPSCPPCDLVRCMDRLEQADCPAGTVLEQGKILGCCPACVKRRDYREECFDSYRKNEYDLDWIE